MRGLDIPFSTGGELLSAYWGYLSDGGLVIEESSLRPGELVALRVTIGGVAPVGSLSGKVLRCRPDGSAVVAFEPGQPHDMLLTQALADAENVPARRHRRYTVDLEAEVENGTSSARARIVNVSASGCCLRLVDEGREALSPGEPVRIASGSLRAQGRVVWARHLERGVEYSEEAHGVLAWVRAYLHTLRDYSG